MTSLPFDSMAYLCIMAHVPWPCQWRVWLPYVPWPCQWHVWVTYVPWPCQWHVWLPYVPWPCQWHVWVTYVPWLLQHIESTLIRTFCPPFCPSGVSNCPCCVAAHTHRPPPYGSATWWQVTPGIRWWHGDTLRKFWWQSDNWSQIWWQSDILSPLVTKWHVKSILVTKWQRVRCDTLSQPVAKWPSCSVSHWIMT